MDIWNSCISLIALCALLAAQGVQAALNPVDIDAMKMNSSEVLMIKVGTVSPLNGGNETDEDPCMQYVNVEAQIKRVNETEMEFSTGDPIEFESYYYDFEEEGCEPYIGPDVPPQLFSGWCGYVFLTPGLNDTYVPSAYGHSFEELIDGQCLLVPDEVGPDDGADEATDDMETSGGETTGESDEHDHDGHDHDHGDGDSDNSDEDGNKDDTATMGSGGSILTMSLAIGGSIISLLI